jgi:deoxyribodipyrimidine photo-lyase
MNPERVKKINNLKENIDLENLNLDSFKKNVLYKMSREIRVEENWGLIRAQKIALENNSKLFVLYTHTNKKWNCVSRTVDFLFEGLKEVSEKLYEKNIYFDYIQNTKQDKISNFLNTFCIENNITTIIYDQAPQREYNFWVNNFLNINKNVELLCADSRNVLPVWHTSDKQEFAARTIRNKIYKKLESFLEKEKNFPEIINHTHNNKTEVEKTFNNLKNYWSKYRKDFLCIESDLVFEETNFSGGESEAKKRLEEFLKNKLDNYDTERNNANVRGQSDLSPYITFGMLSKQYILNVILNRYSLKISDILDPEKNGSGDAKKANTTKLSDNKIKSIRAFIEELVIRGDLSDNFVYYNKNYDNVSGLADWAKLEIEKHKRDVREYLYSLSELEESKTHDSLWNSAQNEMKRTGKMHGYMRMYWAKKILEWTESVEQAIEFAIYLNDKYNLDGWSPNGYTGVLWSIGGLHDRPWFVRPIFGMIRYMARSGCDKKFDTKKYVEKWGNML